MALSAEQTELLQTLAQIAVSFAGFAGVVGAFSRFSAHARVNAFRVRGMVALALFALVAALVPLAIAAFGAGVETTWRTSSGFVAAIGALLFASLMRGVLPLLREGLLHTQWLNVLWYTLATLILVALCTVAAGLVAATAAWGIYGASLSLLLVLCAYNFLMLVLSIRFDD